MKNKMKEIKRTFFPGDEWLYYKIYCGSYSADVILAKKIYLITKELRQEKLIDQWFFIRYNDPRAHLRLRFHLNNVNDLQKVIQLIKSSLANLIKSNIIYDLNIGTYKREIERYGKTTIIKTEKLFYFHSEKTIKLLNKLTSENDEIARIFASLQLVNDLLNHFEIDLINRQKFVEVMALQFKLEHNIEKDNKKNLALLYLKYRADIQLFLEKRQEPHYLNGLINIIDTREKEIKVIKFIFNKIKENGHVNSSEFIASIIHMGINRTFRSKQREYEMLCYDFMYRYYKGLIARK
jgi:thiopeptide-type bacteriocin biosynthesis protein